jgi:hypothetical protein
MHDFARIHLLGPAPDALRERPHAFLLPSPMPETLALMAG